MFTSFGGSFLWMAPNKNTEFPVCSFNSILSALSGSLSDTLEAENGKDPTAALC